MMIRKSLVALLLAFVVVGCGDDSKSGGNSAAQDAGSSDAGADAGASEELVVTREATYEWSTRDVVYGQALRHEGWHSDATTTVDLEATLWEPTGAEGLRPALLIVHGGGFLGGQRDQPQLVEFAEFLAARGFVVMSISYRVLSDSPSMPVEWGEDIDASDDYTDFEKTLGRVMYGATRDAKAAVRYMQANADELGIAPDRIAAMGGSAGAFIAIGLGATEPADFRDELLESDPTLQSTNLQESGEVVAVLNHWGGPEVVTAFELVFETERWDENDAPIQIVHGTADRTVQFSAAEELRTIYEATGVPYTFYAVEDGGHGPWEAEFDGKNLRQLGFEFLIEHQGLTVE